MFSNRGKLFLYMVSFILDVAEALSVEYLPQLGGSDTFPRWFRDFKMYPGTGCVSFVFCLVFSLAWPQHSADHLFRKYRSCALVWRSGV